jgi:protein SCO1/2
MTSSSPAASQAAFDDPHPSTGTDKPRTTALLALAVPLLLTLIFVAAVLVSQSKKRLAAQGIAGGPARVERAKMPENFLPAFQFVDQMGQPFGAKDLADKWWVAGFIFTNCASTCPPMTQSMKRVQEAIAGGPDGIKLVFFTVDPDNDTPEVLALFAERHDVDPHRWRLLTGDREAIWSLARDSFKVGVAPGDEKSVEPILHSERFMLVAPGNKVVEYYHGLDQEEMNKLVAKLRHIGLDLQRSEVLKPKSAVQAPEPASPAADDATRAEILRRRPAAARHHDAEAH